MKFFNIFNKLAKVFHMKHLKYDLFLIQYLSWTGNGFYIVKSPKKMTLEEFQSICKEEEIQIRDSLINPDNPYSNGYSIVLLEKLVENLTNKYKFKIINLPRYEIYGDD